MGKDRAIITDLYESEFFFDSNVFKEIDLKTIEFTKVYRQKDPAFQALLDKIRRKEADDNDLKILNKQQVRPGNENHEKGVLTLTTCYLSH